MQKYIMAILLTAASFLAIIGIIVDLSKHNAIAKASQKEANQKNLIKVVASNYKWDKKVYNVKAGVDYEVKLVLSEGVHAAQLTGPGGTQVKLTKDNPVGHITFTKAGTGVIKCVFPCGPGHPNMHSEIVVQ